MSSCFFQSPPSSSKSRLNFFESVFGPSVVLKVAIGLGMADELMEPMRVLNGSSQKDAWSVKLRLAISWHFISWR